MTGPEDPLAIPQNVNYINQQRANIRYAGPESDFATPETINILRRNALRAIRRRTQEQLAQQQSAVQPISGGPPLATALAGPQSAAPIEASQALGTPPSDPFLRRAQQTRVSAKLGVGPQSQIATPQNIQTLTRLRQQALAGRRKKEQSVEFGIQQSPYGNAINYAELFANERPYYLDPREVSNIEQGIVRVANMFTAREFPPSVTPFQQAHLEIDDATMQSLGYFQQPNGTWIHGTQELIPTTPVESSGGTGGRLGRPIGGGIRNVPGGRLGRSIGGGIRNVSGGRFNRIGLVNWRI